MKILVPNGRFIELEEFLVRRNNSGSAGEQVDKNKVMYHNRSKDIQVLTYVDSSTAGLSGMTMTSNDDTDCLRASELEALVNLTRNLLKLSIVDNDRN